MDIILHVGAHRTATTTFQRMLGHNNPALTAAGMAYWGPKRLRAGLFQGLYRRDDALLPWQTRKRVGRVRLQADIVAQSGAGTLIVSDENMIGTMEGVLQDGQLYAFGGTRAARFADGFAGHTVTVGIGLRSYDAFWASVLAFRLIRGGPLPTPALCDRLIMQPRRWRHVIADLAQAMPFARIAVWTHEAMADRPGELFARLTGRHVALRRAGLCQNAAPGVAALQTYLADCAIDPGIIGDAGGRFMPFDAMQRTILRAQYADDIAWLAGGAGGLADYLDKAGAATHGRTRQQRGTNNGQEHRDLA